MVLKTEHFVCIKNISEGKDIFLQLPMDFGKYICYEVLLGLCSIRVVMPHAIASRKDSPICEDVIRLKIHMSKSVNYAHVRAVCTRLFFSLCRPRKEPGDEASENPGPVVAYKVVVAFI